MKAQVGSKFHPIILQISRKFLCLFKRYSRHVSKNTFLQPVWLFEFSRTIWNTS